MSDALEIHTRDATATMALAAQLAGVLREGDVLGLVGELGAGKTQFVRGMAEGLGITPAAVSSPTFVLMHEYEPGDVTKPILVHIDAYRLTGAKDFVSIGWGDGSDDWREDAIVAVEWADRVSEALNDDWLDVRIEHVDRGRRIVMQPRGAWNERTKQLEQVIEDVKKAAAT